MAVLEQTQETKPIEAPTDPLEFQRWANAGGTVDLLAEQEKQKTAQTPPAKSAEETPQTEDKTGDEPTAKAEEGEPKEQAGEDGEPKPVGDEKTQQKISTLYKQRDKARSRARDMQKQLIELRAEVNTLKAVTQQASNPAREAKAPDAATTNAPETQPQAQGSENDPFPDRKDYASDESYDADVDRWYNGETLELPKAKAPAKPAAETKQPESSAEQSTGEAPKDPFAELTKEQRERAVWRGGVMMDLIESGQKAEPDEDWPSDFEELLLKPHESGTTTIALSDTMVQWLDEHPDEAIVVAKHFTKHPEASRRINRVRSHEVQIERLKSIVKPKTTQKQETQNSGETDSNGVPIVDRLQGTSGETKSAPKLHEIKDYPTFEKMMIAQQALEQKKG